MSIATKNTITTINTNSEESMKKVLTCNECHVTIESGEYCKLCAPYMNETESEESMKNVFTQESIELTDYEQELSMNNYLEDSESTWDMVEESLRMNGAPDHLEIDENGHEVGADKVLNSPLGYVSVPDEKAEYFSTEDNGEQVIGKPGDAELMVTPETELFSIDTTDIENEERARSVFTRKNTISEEEAMMNTINYIRRLESVTTLEELRALQQEVYAKQNEHEWSLAFFFVKGGSKAFWSMYRAKKALLTKEAEVSMSKDINFVKECISNLAKVTNFKELSSLRETVFKMEYSPVTQDIKGQFWSAYRAKKQELVTGIEAHREAVFKECVELIKDTSAEMLFMVSKEIYNSRLPIEVKKVLWFKIRQKQAGEEVTFDMVKGLEFLHEQAKADREKFLSKKSA